MQQPLTATEILEEYEAEKDLFAIFQYCIFKGPIKPWIVNLKDKKRDGWKLKAGESDDLLTISLDMRWKSGAGLIAHLLCASRTFRTEEEAKIKLDELMQKYKKDVEAIGGRTPIEVYCDKLQEKWGPTWDALTQQVQRFGGFKLKE